jgi:thymidylate synthase
MNNLDKQYQTLLQDILDNGVEKKDRTGTGTISVFGRQIRHNMKDGFPLLTTKKMPFKTIVTELLWFLKGDTNIKYLVDNNCHIWDGDCYQAYVKKHKHAIRTEDNRSEIAIQMLEEQLIYPKEEFINKIKTDDTFAKQWGELGPIYGKQWRSWTKFEDESIEHNEWYKSSESIDQIANLINDLKTNPDSRRLMVNTWNVGELGKMVLPPCHNLFQMYSVEKNNKRYLSIMVNIRSNDVPLGLPFNIASYALLLEIIARLTNMISDELIINIGDAHIYLNQIDGVKEQLNREPFDLPKLVISNQVNFNEGIDEFLSSTLITDLQIENYISHPSIKIPLSN